MKIADRLRRRVWSLALGAVLVAALAAGCTQAAPPPSSMEVTHASYLDLSANIADLRSRVTEWQKGDEGSLNIAKEKLERTQVVLGATGWPKAMDSAIAKTRQNMAPMAQALQAQDAVAAQAVAKDLGDASHDVTHAFYGDWLPALEGNHYGPLAAHVIYLDLSTNLNDAQTRLAAWQTGDESGLTIAKEKVERAEVLIQHLRATGTMTKRLPALERGLLATFTALEAQDKGLAQQAAGALAASAQELTTDSYALLDLVVADGDPGSVQASYLNLTRNIAALRAGVAAWQKGDKGGLTTAADGLARVKTILAHAQWPRQMALAIDRTRGAVEPMAAALQASSAVAAGEATQEFGDASHDVTHAYYGDWLAGGALAAAAQPGASQSAQKTGGGHQGHGEEVEGQAAVAETGADWLVLGGFGAALALVVGVAALTKPRTPARQTGNALPEPGEA